MGGDSTPLPQPTSLRRESVRVHPYEEDVLKVGQWISAAVKKMITVVADVVVHRRRRRREGEGGGDQRPRR